MDLCSFSHIVFPKTLSAILSQHKPKFVCCLIRSISTLTCEPKSLCQNELNSLEVANPPSWLVAG